MNRVPVREAGSRSSDSLERRVNLLTYLVVIQVVLLAVLLLIEFLPDFEGISFRDSSAGIVEADKPPVQVKQKDAKPSEPVVKTEESGNLPPEIPPTRPVRVEILNGCGVPKLAAEFATALRAFGYDVRDTRNADRLNYEASLIYDRTALPGQASALAGKLGIPASRVVDSPNSQLVDVDITLILGNDHSTLKRKP